MLEMTVMIMMIMAKAAMLCRSQTADAFMHVHGRTILQTMPSEE